MYKLIIHFFGRSRFVVRNGGMFTYTTVLVARIQNNITLC